MNDWSGDCSLAVLFFGALLPRDKWEIALKGFKMIESPLVREWKDAARIEGKIEGKIETKIDWLMRVVRGRYKGDAEPLSEGIRACCDPETLDRWLDVALTVDTLAEFRKQTGL